jgi:hypothetical protein
LALAEELALPFTSEAEAVAAPRRVESALACAVPPAEPLARAVLRPAVVVAVAAVDAPPVAPAVALARPAALTVAEDWASEFAPSALAAEFEVPRPSVVAAA